MPCFIIWGYNLRRRRRRSSGRGRAPPRPQTAAARLRPSARRGAAPLQRHVDGGGDAELGGGVAAEQLLARPLREGGPFCDHVGDDHRPVPSLVLVHKLLGGREAGICGMD